MSKVFGFRLPDDLRKYLECQAKRNRTSIGHYIVMLIFYDMRDNEKAEAMQRKFDAEMEVATENGTVKD